MANIVYSELDLDPMTDEQRWIAIEPQTGVELAGGALYESKVDADAGSRRPCAICGDSVNEAQCLRVCLVCKREHMCGSESELHDWSRSACLCNGCNLNKYRLGQSILALVGEAWLPAVVLVDRGLSLDLVLENQNIYTIDKKQLATCTKLIN